MREVYLDNAATTRTDPDIAQIALNIMCEEYGNPSSLHAKGTAARKALENARGQLADVIGCQPQEVYFTSGGTESNNLALTGAYFAHHRRGKRILSTAVEHSSVLRTFSWLGGQGASAALIPPLPSGLFDENAIQSAVDENTILLSCMMVNSETGAIAPIEAIASGAKSRNRRILVHCDGVQALGKLSFSATALGVDLMSFSGHKIHAPKGIGALYIRSGVRIHPLMHGGAQEFDRKQNHSIRPGTENVPLACALAAAATKLRRDHVRNAEHYRALSEHFTKKAAKSADLCINSPEKSAPYIWNLSAPGFLSAHLVAFLSQRGIYVSGGSACAGGKESHILTAMGLSPARIKGALRVSFCPDTTVQDLDDFFDALQTALTQLARSY